MIGLLLDNLMLAICQVLIILGRHIVLAFSVGQIVAFQPSFKQCAPQSEQATTAGSAYDDVSFGQTHTYSGQHLS